MIGDCANWQKKYCKLIRRYVKEIHPKIHSGMLCYMAGIIELQNIMCSNRMRTATTVIASQILARLTIIRKSRIYHVDFVLLKRSIGRLTSCDVSDRFCILYLMMLLTRVRDVEKNPAPKSEIVKLLEKATDKQCRSDSSTYWISS